MKGELYPGFLAIVLTACGSGITAAPTDTESDTTTGNWWDDGSGGTTTAGDGGDDDEGDYDDEYGDYDDEDDEDGEDELGEAFWGEVWVAESEGAVGYFKASQSKGVECEMEYPAEGVSTTDTCGPCSVAFVLMLGEKEVFEEQRSACEVSGYADLQGTTLRVGAAADASLYMDEGSGWQLVPDGLGELVDGGALFYFEIGTWE